MPNEKSIGLNRKLRSAFEYRTRWAIAPTILTPTIRHELVESPLPGPNDFKSAESSLPIGPFLTGIELSLESSLPQQMTKSVKAMIVKLHLLGDNCEAIYAAIHLSSYRISRTLDNFRRSGFIPRPRHSSWPKKITTDVQDYINVRSIQSAIIPAMILMVDICQKLTLIISPNKIGSIRKDLWLRYQAARSAKLKEKGIALNCRQHR